jgi:RNA polymerase sigma-70 factor (ECF subfamily)
MDETNHRGLNSHSNSSNGQACPDDPYAKLRDDQLVAALQVGDTAALGALFERHRRVVYGFLRSRLLDSSDAEDMCQEVFVRCLQARGEFEGAHQVRPWLVGIARNVLREYVRRMQRRKEVGWTLLCLEADASHENGRAYDDVAEFLPGCMEGLGQNARDALEMHYRGRMRLAAIGERLRRSEGAIKLLMYRARQALKNCINLKSGCKVEEAGD